MATDFSTKLEEKKNKIGLVGTRLSFSRPAQGKGISEHITQDWKEIVIRIRRDLNLIPDEETKRYVHKSLAADPVETVAMDMLYHGCGHRELPTYTGMGCPHEVKNHDRILDGIAQALKEKRKSGLESYVANAFEDILDNVNARRHTSHIGQILFWNNEGLESETQKYPAFYEAFVKINLAMMGCVADATLLKRFWANDAQVQTAVRQFKDYLKRTLDVSSVVKLYEDKDLVEKLFDTSTWREMGYQFALATANLLEDQPSMRLCFGLPADGNPFDKEIKLPGTQEDIAEGRYKAGMGVSQHTDPLVQLDALYRKISRAIPVQTSEYTRASGIPLIFHGKRAPHEDETITLRRMKGIGFDDEGELALKVARHEIKHPAHYKVHPRQFPKLKVALIDASGSMGYNADNETDGAGKPLNVGNTSFIPWGDNSKYHFALKGLYGIDNFLERQGIANYVESEVIIFSSATTSTGRGTLRNEQERRALLRPPAGGTVLNPAALKSEESYFLVSISDGDVQNWTGWHKQPDPSASTWEEKAGITIRDAYRNAIKNKEYCHIHIGAANQFTQDLESWGVPVKYVRGDNDLSTLLLDVTATYYKRGIFA